MNGNILIVLLLTILFGAGTTTYVVTERKAHHDEILFLSDHVKTYANYVSTAARNNRSLVGSLTREQANVPAFLELDPSIGNYVDRGVAYVFFTLPRLPMATRLRASAAIRSCAAWPMAAAESCSQVRAMPRRRRRRPCRSVRSS